MHYIKAHSGNFLLLCIVTLPLIMWVVSDGLMPLIDTPGTAIASLGKATALMGVALYLFLPVLSIRYEFITRLFGGISKAHTLHLAGGKISFFLITAHPIFLGLGRMMNGSSLSTIWDWTSLLLISGIVAFIIFAATVGISVYSHIKHQRWLIVHHFFGWLIPLFFLHGLLAQNKLLNNKGLFWYFTLLGIVGFAAFLYRSVFARYFMHRYGYEVCEVNHLSDSVIEVVLKPTTVSMTFEPGQFAYVSFDFPGIDPEAHPYSFSNSNNGPYVRFTIKNLGDDTAQLRDITPGTKALIEGPYGNFSYQNTKNMNQIWIAGGIGITPFLSMARSFSGNKEYDIRFYYGTESFEEAVFLQEFIDITRHLPENFHTTVVSKQISGFVTAEFLKASLGKLEVFDYFICGPPGMMKSLVPQLTGAGVPIEQIHIESFSMR